MLNLNRVVVAGGLTKDPEVRKVPSGQTVANLRLAVNRRYKAGNGQMKEEVTYLGVEVWGKSAEGCGEYLKKSSRILVEGRLKTKEWESPDGQKRSMIEIVAERVHFVDGAPTAKGIAALEGHGDPPPGGEGDEIPF